MLPVMTVDQPLYEVATSLHNLTAAILPTSEQKIQAAKVLFEQYADTNNLIAVLNRPEEGEKMMPKLFQHRMREKCMANPQHIVLPEGLEPRVLRAAEDLVNRKLAKVTVLGPPADVKAEAAKLGLSLDGVGIVDPKVGHI